LTRQSFQEQRGENSHEVWKIKGPLTYPKKITQRSRYFTKTITFGWYIVLLGAAACNNGCKNEMWLVGRHINPRLLLRYGFRVLVCLARVFQCFRNGYWVVVSFCKRLVCCRIFRYPHRTNDATSYNDTGNSWRRCCCIKDILVQLPSRLDHRIEQV
jgi:hypothetical protein